MTNLFTLSGDVATARNGRSLRSMAHERSGHVSIVGSGPGNPELLTLRAFKLLQLAEVVLYDHLVAPEIVALARPGAELIYVGKQRSPTSTWRQVAANAST